MRQAGDGFVPRDLLPPRFELERMESLPFGVDEDGAPVAQGTSAPIQGVLRALRESVETRVRASAPALATAEGVQRQVDAAWGATLDALIARLNAAIVDRRYHLTREYLLNPTHRYSYEFYAYLAEYARRLSGDPDLLFLAGRYSIPAGIIRLARPLGIQGVFAALPTLSRRISDNDIRSVSTTPTSAVIRWHGTELAEYVAPSARVAYITAACEAYRGGLASVPAVLYGDEPAQARQRSCMTEGAEYCEWELTWRARRRNRWRDPLLGVAASLLVLVYGLSGAPGSGLAVLVIASLLPALLVWEAARVRRLTSERDEQHRLLLEQRESTQAEFDSREQANEALQAANQQLERRLAELTAVHEVGLALSTTLDVDELLGTSLNAIVRHLNFERAMVLLVDEEQGRLVYAHSAGTRPEETQIASQLALPLDDIESPLVQVLRAPEPLHFDDLSEHPDERRRQVARALGVTELLGTPLLTKGRRIGVVGVDNGRTRRPIPETASPLLFTVGNLLAAAIENARLYRQVEEQNRVLEERVAERTRALQEAYEAQAQAEQRFQQLVEQLPLTVYIDRTDEKSSNVYTSPQLEAVLGYSIEEWQTDEDLFMRVVHPDDLDAVMAEHERTRESGDDFRMEYRMIARDGTVRWFLDQAIVVRDERGRPAFHHGFLLDITDRKKLEVALAEAETRYRRLVEELPLTVYIDEPTALAASKYVSPQIESLLGYPTERWNEPGFFPSILHPDDHDRVMADHERVFATTQARWTFEYRLIASHGRPVWVRDEAVIVRDGEGVPSYVQGFLIDITDRKEAEIALREQREYFASLLEISPVAVVVIDTETRIQSWNPAAERLFGYRAEEVVGELIDDIVARDPSMRDEAARLNAEASSFETSLITRRTRKDGTLVDVEVRVAPIRDVDGKARGAYAIYHDITELQRAREDADAANAAKSAFLAAMSHEIRTPMNAVIGMAGLLLETPLDEEQRDYAQTLAASGEALLTIINDILDFSKIEAGRMELELAPFDLGACVESALDLIAPVAARKDIELAYDADASVPRWLVGDAGRLRQILLNLLNNAVKFTDAGEVVLSLRGHPEDGTVDRWRIEIEVRDTGIGIPPDRIGRLFQSFSQADATTSRRYGGTGLGLAISRRLAELMGGTIDVRSEGVPGRGSRFTLSLPAQVADGAPVAAERPDAAMLAGRRLLIVDDNDTNRRILRLQTRAWGLIARDTPSPAEALEWVRAGDPFDIAIIDRQMPEMDGLTLAGRLRELPGGRRLPIVICSSLGMRDAAVRAAEAEHGLAGYLPKPVKPSSLLDTLVDTLAGGRADATEGGEPGGRGDRDGHGDGGAPSSAEPTRTESGNRAGLRILLAEDNAVNRKLALRLLERLGYTAAVAENGREAVEAVERESFDAVLMDVQMPEMDGLEASREICARWPRDARPRIIAMTANAMQGDREACLEAGMDDYLSKPIRPDELRRALEEVRPRAGVGSG